MSNEYWNRRDLYDLVWAQPVTHVGEQFGVSGVAIAKACRKLKVPVPGRGYWARKANGYAVRQVPLKDAKDVPPVSRPQPSKKEDRPPANEGDQKEFQRIEELLKSGAFRPKRTSPGRKEHPLVTLTAKEGKRAQADSRHLSILPKACLDIRVTKASFDRALEVMERILDLAEAQSIEVGVTDNKTWIRHLGQEVQFGIVERVWQFELPPGTRGKYDSGPIFAGKPVDYAPTGLLTLEIREYTDLRKHWNDTKRQIIEQSTPEFFATLLKSAVVLHRWAEDRRLDQLERARQAAERETLREQLKSEQKRFSELLEMSENWRRARTLREFLAACREEGRKSAKSEGGAEFEAWLKWGEEQANRLDPLGEAHPSILDCADEI